MVLVLVMGEDRYEKEAAPTTASFKQSFYEHEKCRTLITSHLTQT